MTIAKIIQTGSFKFAEAAVAIVPMHRNGVDHGFMQKRASKNVFAKEIAKIAADGGVKGHSVLHVIIVGDSERYGCLAAGTLIALPDGSHADIDQLQVGDVLLSASGQPRDVIKTFERVVPTARKVRVECLPEPIVMSDEHPIKRLTPGQLDCIRSHGEPCKPGLSGNGQICNRGQGCSLSDRTWATLTHEQARADQLTTSDYLVLDLPVLPVERLISNSEARLLGYWLAEGCVQRRSKGASVAMRFSFGRSERDTLVADTLRLGAELGFVGHVYDQTEERGEFVVTMSHCSDVLKEWVSWCGHGAGGKRIPWWMLSLPDEARLNLLYGYLMGDGTAAISVKENRVTACSVSYDLAVGIQRLLWSVGVPASMCRVKATPKARLFPRGRPPGKRQVPYHVSYALAKAPLILQLGAESIPRKWSSVRSFIVGRTVYLPVRAVEPIEWDQPVYNLEVAEDHDYISVNFYSHNCNRNADGFSGEDNKTAHTGFKEHGNHFAHHKNDDPMKKTGMVLATAYNEDMARIELLTALENKKYAAELAGFEKGEDIPYSMGSMQAYDECSICGHKAPTAEDHCEHVQKKLGELLDDGRVVYMKNPRPYYFDASTVWKPADRIGYALAKVANANQVIGGHELAASLGIRPWGSQKQATLMCLAAMEKRLSGMGKVVSTAPQKLSPESVKSLKTACVRYGTPAVLSYLHKSSCLLGFEDFMEVIVGQNKFASVVDIDESLLVNGFSKLAEASDEVGDLDGDDSSSDVNLDDDATEELDQSTGMKVAQVASRSMTRAIIVPTVKTAGLGDPLKAEGLADLYLHYKLSFANHEANRDNPFVLQATVLSHGLRTQF